MNSVLQKWQYNLGDPTDASALGAATVHEFVPVGCTIVGISVAPMEDDTGATLDVNGGASDITAVACAVAATPGTWISTHFGGTQTPVSFAAGDELTIDLNNAAAGNRFDVAIWVLLGVTSAAS